MQELTLMQTVTVTGQNLFGRPSYLSFSPIPSTVPINLRSAWLWKPTGENHRFIPIDLDIVGYRKRRLRLIDSTACLEVIEHIAPLRWLGIGPLVIEGCGWTPYYGRPYEYFDVMRPFLLPTEREVQWLSPQQPVYHNHRGELGGYSQFTPRDPALSPELNLSVTVRYPRLGKMTVQRTIPSQHILLMNDLRSYTQGLPHSLYYLSAFGAKIGLWKHHHHVRWYYEQPYSEEQIQATLCAFASHRVIDLLGALALLHPIRLLSGTVVSVFGGHHTDLAFINKMLPYAPPP